MTGSLPVSPPDLFVVVHPPEGRAYLVVFAGDKERHLVGRFDAQSKTPADLLIDDRTVSRRHCEFLCLRAAGGWTIADLNSVNGTLLNGARVAPDRPSALAHGGQIRIGDSLLTLGIGAPPAGAPPTALGPRQGGLPVAAADDNPKTEMLPSKARPLAAGLAPPPGLAHPAVAHPAAAAAAMAPPAMASPMMAPPTMVVVPRILPAVAAAPAPLPSPSPSPPPAPRLTAPPPPLAAARPARLLLVAGREGGDLGEPAFGGDLLDRVVIKEGEEARVVVRDGRFVIRVVADFTASVAAATLPPAATGVVAPPAPVSAAIPPPAAAGLEALVAGITPENRRTETAWGTFSDREAS
ncbi:MAG: FHA domain-containing protein [Azospirillum sp.]|nr:FHA domain-containing protein [Azospirillum sp.]